MKTLVVTNDFPPREGGIQTFVRSLVGQLDPAEVTVYASTSEGSAAYDANQPFEIIRNPTTMLLPTPAVAKGVAGVVRRLDADRVLFGAAAPLGLIAPSLRAAGAQRLVGLTHGHETGWAMLPVSRQLLRRITAGLDVTTYITDYTRDMLRPALPDADLRRLPPGVDIARFHPGVDGAPIRERLGIGDAATVVCISRLVPRKGQDMLIRAFPRVLAEVPNARLVIVGGGRDERRLRALAARWVPGGQVIFAGRPDWDELPAYYAAGDVFAMPCRTRRGGLDVEGLGMVYLEAAATGIPVVAGTSGGAPEAVRRGVTGIVLRDPRDAAETARALIDVLGDPERARAMGAAGRSWVEQEWTWQRQGERLRDILT